MIEPWLVPAAMLVLFVILCHGLPPFWRSVSRQTAPADTFPKVGFIAAAFLIMAGIDWLYRNTTPMAAAQKRMEELVELVNGGQQGEALRLLEKTASNPPWEQFDEPLEEISRGF
jgi:hypothetical protein